MFAIRPRIRRAFRLALRRRDLTDEEIDEELRFHVETRVAQLMARGRTRDEADAEARRRFGESWAEAVARLHDAGHRREERLAMRERLDGWWHDVRYAARTLSRQPGFALVVIGTFALGIGANATMFGVIDHLLLQPPPGIGDARSLGVVMLINRQTSNAIRSSLHYPLADALRRDSSVFTDVAAVTEPQSYPLGRGTTAEEIKGSLVSGPYFTALRTHAALGRLIGDDDDRDVAPAAAVVSHTFWERRFGGDRRVIGKALQIGPRFFTIVGVAERDFTGIDHERVDVWLPLAGAGELRGEGANWRQDWGSYWVQIVARVRPGTAPTLANAHLNAAFVNGRAAFARARGREPERDVARLELRSILPAEQLRNDPQTQVAKLLVAVSIAVLLIACANVTNLLVARGTERRREIAVRLALGVSRRRLVRLLFTETTMLAILGAVIALGVAALGVRLLRATLLEQFAPPDSLIDGRLVTATIGLAIVTSLMAGLAPAWSSSNPDVATTLKTGGREGSVRRSRIVATLIAVQAALSVALLVGAGLFVTSLRHVAALRLGYETDRVIAAGMELETLGFKDADRLALFETMRDRIASLPGVSSVAISATHPLHGHFFAHWGVGVAGRDSLPASPSGGPYDNTVSADYFRTLGLRIVEGRPISAADIAADARVVVLSEPMARAYWPRESAVGRCMFLDDSTCTTVVGVAADAREWVRASADRFIVYLPASQRWMLPTSVLLVRSRDDRPDRLVAAIRRSMQTSAPNLPYADVRLLSDLLARQTRPWRMGASLFTAFGVLALVIAAVGLYSAISYNVTQRRHEFGVRRALGAQITDVVQLVLGQGVRATAVGVAVGLLGAFLSARFVAELLFDTSPRNPVVFVAVAAIMLLVATAATLIPAWRASRVDPVTALRAD